MPDIRILPEIISNKIAAGEVVERPVSVVKELVENALDAGATQITVEVNRGGRDLIRVTDDGHGMSRDNALLAIERYATSKIKDDEDLFSIKSFGFRGEALPSMASVSKFTLISRERNGDAAVRIEIHGGRLNNVLEMGAPVGTEVVVKDLYFNTPARRKFLKSINTEMGHIADAVSSIALAFPDVAFRLIHNGRTVKDFTSSDDFKTRVGMVLGMGRESLDNLYPLNPDRLSGKEPWRENALQDSDSGGDAKKMPLQVTGYVGAPAFNRSSGSKILLFVNRRVVTDRTMASAILRGYKGRLMKGRFPVAAIFLSLPYDEVDVNVHPAKLQVRFLNQGAVFAALSGAVHQALFMGERQKVEKSGGFMESAATAESAAESEDSATFDGFATPEGSATFNGSAALDSSAALDGPAMPESPATPESVDRHSPMDKSLFLWDAPASPSPSSEEVVEKEINEEREIPSFSKDQTGIVSESSSVEYENRNLLGSKAKRVEPSPSFFSSLHIVGQLFDTYIVAQSSNEMILIDQHAAHERVVFEKLKSRSTTFRPPSQQLIVPEMVALNYREAAMAERIIPALFHLGIEMESFGEKTFLIKSIPAIIDDKELKPLILDILDALLETGMEWEPGNGDGAMAGMEEGYDLMASEGRDWLDDILLLISCHHSVRAHHRLDPREVDALLLDLDRCKTPFHCPHGRPVTLSFSQNELERRFKRTGA